MNEKTDGTASGTDGATRGLVEMLDALGEHERREPDAGFEQRIARETRPGVVGRVTPTRGNRWSPGWVALPVAAALLLGVFGLWMQRSASAPPGGGSLRLVWDENDVDDLLFIDGLWDQSPITADMDETETANENTADEQTADELLFDVLEGGST